MNASVPSTSLVSCFSRLSPRERAELKMRIANGDKQAEKELENCRASEAAESRRNRQQRRARRLAGDKLEILRWEREQENDRRRHRKGGRKGKDEAATCGELRERSDVGDDNDDSDYFPPDDCMSSAQDNEKASQSVDRVDQKGEDGVNIQDANTPRRERDGTRFTNNENAIVPVTTTEDAVAGVALEDEVTIVPKRKKSPVVIDLCESDGDSVRPGKQDVVRVKKERPSDLSSRTVKQEVVRVEKESRHDLSSTIELQELARKKAKMEFDKRQMNAKMTLRKEHMEARMVFEREQMEQKMALERRQMELEDQEADLKLKQLRAKGGK